MNNYISIENNVSKEILIALAVITLVAAIVSLFILFKNKGKLSFNFWFLVVLTLVFSVFTQLITLSERPTKDTVELTKDSTHLILTNKLNKQKVVKIKTGTFKKVSIVLLENEVKKIPIEKEEGWTFDINYNNENITIDKAKINEYITKKATN
jgi:hypothetical protein